MLLRMVQERDEERNRGRGEKGEGRLLLLLSEVGRGCDWKWCYATRGDRKSMVWIFIFHLKTARYGFSSYSQNIHWGH